MSKAKNTTENNAPVVAETPVVVETPAPVVVETPAPVVVETPAPEITIDRPDTVSFYNALERGARSNSEIKSEGAKLLADMAIQARKIRTEIHEAEYQTMVIGTCTNLYNKIKDSLNGGVGQQIMNLVYKFAEEANNPEVRKILALTSEDSIKVAEVKNFKLLLDNVNKVGEPINEVYDPKVKYKASMISNRMIAKAKGSKDKVVNLWDFNKNEEPFKTIEVWEKEQSEVAFEESKNIAKIAGGAASRLFKLDVQPQMTKDISDKEYGALVDQMAADWAAIMKEEFTKLKEAK